MWSAGLRRRFGWIAVAAECEGELLTQVRVWRADGIGFIEQAHLPGADLAGVQRSAKQSSTHAGVVVAAEQFAGHGVGFGFAIGREKADVEGDKVPFEVS